MTHPPHTAARVLACGFALASLMCGADGFTGTWELNIAKSKPEPGFTHKRVTLTIEQIGPDDTRCLFDQTTNIGGKRPVEVVYAFDGKERPVTINGTTSMTTAKTLDASTRRILTRRAGKIVYEGVWKLSTDGKVLTITATHSPEGRQPYSTVFVYEK